MHTKHGILVLCAIVVFGAAIFKLQRVIKRLQLATMEFQISKTWDGSEIDHASIFISLSAREGKGLQVDVKAPFFNSPPAPNSPAGQPCDRLWDYEIFMTYSGRSFLR